MTAPEFRTKFEPCHGEAVQVLPGVLRVTAPNSGPYTFHGTNSYIVGRETLAVIDPGPDDPGHLETLLAAIDGRPVSHILITHTHVDHSPLSGELARQTGAKTVGEGPHRIARPLQEGETNPFEESSDFGFLPDQRVKNGDVLRGDEWQFEAVLTPGHTMNHAVYALLNENIIFSGDHVMAWSTSIVAPPDGAMADYMQSLDAMLQRPETIYLPGHGGRLNRAPEFVRGLRAHRRMREAAILARIRAGDRTVAEIVQKIYRDTDPRLHGAAGFSVLAHLEDLVAAGKVESNGPVSLNSQYRPA